MPFLEEIMDKRYSDKRHKQRFAIAGATMAGAVAYHFAAVAQTGSSLFWDVALASGKVVEAYTGGMIPAFFTATMATLGGVVGLGAAAYRGTRDIQLGHFGERIKKKKDQVLGKDEEKEGNEKGHGRFKWLAKLKSLGGRKEKSQGKQPEVQESEIDLGKVDPKVLEMFNEFIEAIRRTEKDSGREIPQEIKQKLLIPFIAKRIKEKNMSMPTQEELYKVLTEIEKGSASKKNGHIEKTQEELTERPQKEEKSWFDEMVAVKKGNKKIPGVEKPKNGGSGHGHSSHYAGFFSDLVHRRKGGSQEHSK